MKFNILNTLLLFILISCSANSQGHLSPDAFEAGLNKDPRHLLIDVRTPEEFNESRLPNSVNIDYQNEKFIDNIKVLDKERPVYVYCHSGRRSVAAQKIMKEQGFQKVYNLEGGIKRWKEMNKQLETSNSSQ